MFTLFFCSIQMKLGYVMPVVILKKTESNIAVTHRFVVRIINFSMNKYCDWSCCSNAAWMFISWFTKFHTINSNSDHVDVICEEIIKYLQAQSLASQVNVSLIITNFNSWLYPLTPYENYAESLWGMASHISYNSFRFVPIKPWILSVSIWSLLAAANLGRWRTVVICPSFFSVMWSWLCVLAAAWRCSSWAMAK